MHRNPPAVLALALAAGSANAQTVHVPGATLTVEATGLANPQGVDVDRFARPYVADSARGRIVRVDPAGVLTPIITSIPVSTFFGVDIGPLAVHITNNDDLIYGEGGRATGVEQLHHHTLDGTLVRSLDPAPFGGNWSGAWVDPDTNTLWSVSANGDRVFTHAPDAASWSAPSLRINTTTDLLISPVGAVVRDNTAYVAFFGSFGGSGSVATYDATTGALLNPAFATGFKASAIDLLPSGDLLVTDYADAENAANAYLIDADTGAATLLVSGLNFATGIAAGPDGSVYITEQGLPGSESGRLLRLSAIPAPATLAGPAALALLAPFARRRPR